MNPNNLDPKSMPSVPNCIASHLTAASDPSSSELNYFDIFVHIEMLIPEGYRKTKESLQDGGQHLPRRSKSLVMRDLATALPETGTTPQGRWAICRDVLKSVPCSSQLLFSPEAGLALCHMLGSWGLLRVSVPVGGVRKAGEDRGEGGLSCSPKGLRQS